MLAASDHLVHTLSALLRSFSALTVHPCWGGGPIFFFLPGREHVPSSTFLQSKKELRNFDILRDMRRPGSSVGIATDYGLDGPGIESRLGARFSAVQIDPGAHPASCTRGTGSFPGYKAAGA